MHNTEEKDTNEKDTAKNAVRLTVRQRKVNITITCFICVRRNKAVAIVINSIKSFFCVCIFCVFFSFLRCWLAKWTFSLIILKHSSFHRAHRLLFVFTAGIHIVFDWMWAPIFDRFAFECVELCTLCKMFIRKIIHNKWTNYRMDFMPWRTIVEQNSVTANVCLTPIWLWFRLTGGYCLQRNRLQIIKW